MSNFRYSLLKAPEASNDGSGVIKHNIQMEYSNGDWTVVAGRHKDVCVPAAELATVLAMPSGADKVTAYKQLLVSNLNTQPTPITGWSIAQVQAFLDANVLAIQTATDANDYITVTLGLSYPVPFNL